MPVPSNPSRPLGIVLCHPSDLRPPADSRARWEAIFASNGTDPSNVTRYWQDQSYGQFHATTVIRGWFDIGHTVAEVNAFTGQAQRRQLATWGAATAQAQGVVLSDFCGVVFCYNAGSDHGGVGSNRAVIICADGGAFEPTFMQHEVGHVLGLNHSSGSDTGDYGDPYDIMSAMSVFSYRDTLGRSSGPGAAAINLENLGWLPRPRLWAGWPAGDLTLTLAALNRPMADGWLAAKIVPPRGGKPTYLEFRLREGWDAGLPGARVLVQTRNGANGPEIAGGGRQARGALAAGASLTLPTEPPLTITVQSVDAAAGTAVVRLTKVPAPLVRYGMTLKMQHIPTGVHLHSHPLTYSHPGTSGQQQVTGYAAADDNDYWIVRGPHGTHPTYRLGEPVSHGDAVRLMHVATGRNLHSHAGIPSPLTRQQEVTCYGTAGVGDGNDTWRVELNGGTLWESQAGLRLVHVPTNVALHSHAGHSHPTLTAGQQEVTGYPGRDDNDLWIASEVRAHDAAVMSVRMPRSMTVNSSATASVRMRNLGAVPWAPGVYRLVSVPQPVNAGPATDPVDLPAGVEPGQDATFTFTLRAPSTPGSYSFGWQMHQQKLGGFGQIAVGEPVLVMAADNMVVVPDVRGEDRGSAGVSLRDAGLRPIYQGAGNVVRGQMPAAGSRVALGTAVTCRLGVDRMASGDPVPR